MSRKNLLYVIAALVLIAAVAFGIGLHQIKKTVDDSNNQPTTSNSPTSTDNINPVTKYQTDSDNISVTEPAPNSNVPLMFVVDGKARVFENVVSIRVKDLANSKTYVNTSFNSFGSMGEFGPYSYLVDLTSHASEIKAGDKLQLEVYQSSAKDGREIDKVTMPLTVQPETKQQMAVKVYFLTPNAQQTECNIVFPAIRVVNKTTAVGTTAINELLKGPTQVEDKAGFRTSLNKGSQMNSLTIASSTATVDFNGTLQQNVGGSCRVSSIRAQITQTLKQFSSVKNVIIQVNGDAETALQP